MTEFEAIDNSINIDQEKIDFADAIDKLKRNPQFKKVILQGYFEQEAQNLVHMLSDPNMQSPEMQSNIQNAMRGIGELRTWFKAKEIQGIMSKKNKAQLEERREYLELNPEEQDTYLS